MMHAGATILLSSTTLALRLPRIRIDMASLLDDLIAAAADPKTRVSDLLRRVRTFASQFSIPELTSWTGAELNGYPDGSEVPDYRLILGQLSALSERGRWRPVEFSSSELNEVHRRRPLLQPIAELEAISGEADGGEIQFEVPFELRREIIKLLRYETQVSWFTTRASIAAVTDAVRTFALDRLTHLSKHGARDSAPPTSNKSSDLLSHSLTAVSAYFKLARESIDQFPSARWVFGVIAIVAAIGIAKATLDSWQILAFGALGVFCCGGLLTLAGWAHETRRLHKKALGAATAFVWFCLILFSAWTLLFTSCVFFKFPASTAELFKTSSVGESKSPRTDAESRGTVLVGGAADFEVLLEDCPMPLHVKVVITPDGITSSGARIELLQTAETPIRPAMKGQIIPLNINRISFSTNEGKSLSVEVRILAWGQDDRNDLEVASGHIAIRNLNAELVLDPGVFLGTFPGKPGLSVRVKASTW